MHTLRFQRMMGPSVVCSDASSKTGAELHPESGGRNHRPTPGRRARSGSSTARICARIVLLGVVTALAACGGGEAPAMSDGGDCDPRAAGCNGPDPGSVNACRQRCGDGCRDPGEQCDDGNRTNGDDCEADCTLPRCGNGIMDRGEECDDGNRSNGDGCEADCTLARCGNGIMDRGEECDDGNRVSGDGCEFDCTLPLCGDGIRDPGEECDDGNHTDGDG